MDIQVKYDTKEFLDKLGLDEYDEPEEVEVEVIDENVIVTLKGLSA